MVRFVAEIILGLFCAAFGVFTVIAVFLEIQTEVPAASPARAATATSYYGCSNYTFERRCRYPVSDGYQSLQSPLTITGWGQNLAVEMALFEIQGDLERDLIRARQQRRAFERIVAEQYVCY